MGERRRERGRGRSSRETAQAVPHLEPGLEKFPQVRSLDEGVVLGQPVAEQYRSGERRVEVDAEEVAPKHIVHHLVHPPPLLVLHQTVSKQPQPLVEKELHEYVAGHDVLLPHHLIQRPHPPRQLSRAEDVVRLHIPPQLPPALIVDVDHRCCH
eukprot:767203-Hanusia_phi.AAC.4